MVSLVALAEKNGKDHGTVLSLTVGLLSVMFELPSSSTIVPMAVPAHDAAVGGGREAADRNAAGIDREREAFVGLVLCQLRNGIPHDCDGNDDRRLPCGNGDRLVGERVIVDVAGGRRVRSAGVRGGAGSGRDGEGDRHALGAVEEGGEVQGAAFEAGRVGQVYMHIVVDDRNRADLPADLDRIAAACDGRRGHADRFIIFDHEVAGDRDIDRGRQRTRRDAEGDRRIDEIDARPRGRAARGGAARHRRQGAGHGGVDGIGQANRDGGAGGAAIPLAHDKIGDEQGRRGRIVVRDGDDARPLGDAGIRHRADCHVEFLGRFERGVADEGNGDRGAG